MKNFAFAVFIFCIAGLVSCSRKTVPSKSTTPTADTTAISNNTIPNNSKEIADSSTTVTKSTASIMVVADGYGRLITPQQNLPQDAGVQYNSLQLSKGLTTQQRANLQARYKTVPPRVLYVPKQNEQRSLKGAYYIYKNKFWYWKKDDGLFYLDQKYYM